MDIVTAEVVGTISIVVYQTPDGDKIFRIEVNNEDLSPVIDILEDTLIKY